MKFKKRNKFPSRAFYFIFNQPIATDHLFKRVGTMEKKTTIFKGIALGISSFVEFFASLSLSHICVTLMIQ